MTWVPFYGRLKHAASWTLLRIGGWSIRIHRFTETDETGYHSHPATALRLVLRGGYVEEMPDLTRRTWFPGRVGIVRTGTIHRIAKLRAPASYSLWIRAPHRARVLFIPMPDRQAFLANPTGYEQNYHHLQPYETTVPKQ